MNLVEMRNLTQDFENLERDLKGDWNDTLET